MDSFQIKGPSQLNGSITVDGSKNAALPIIAGALLIDKGETTIRNVPPLRDIFTLIKMTEHLGAKVSYDDNEQELTISAEKLVNNSAPYELMSQMRASFLVLGPILSRLGEARISLPGGCSLGSRPVDYHLKAFAALGAEVTEKGGYVLARGKPLTGGAVYFDKPTHTGTENLLFGAIFARDKTVITNAACDPEIIDVVEFLNKAGAKISGAGTPNITVEPVKGLKPICHTVSGDRLVAGTYLIGAAMTGGKVEIRGICPSHLTMVIHKLVEMGARIETTGDLLTVEGPDRLTATSVTTFPYPGFPTDLQACISAAAGIAMGTSHIRETVFIDRFSHAMELRRLGVDINVLSGEATIRGVERLSGAEVMAPDIRAGAGILLGCVAAEGEATVRRVYHIDRGYARLEEKLSSLGADIKRVST